MTDAVLRWGILSTANIGRVAVIPAIQASRNGRVTAVASRDAARAAAFATQAGIPSALGSYQALLPIRRSTPSTSRSPTTSIANGPSAPPSGASTSSARSLSPSPGPSASRWKPPRGPTASN